MNKSEIIALAAEYLDVFTSKMEKMPDTANVKRLVAELYAIAASAGDAPAVQGEPVGEVAPMPGAKGFTMACFSADQVPVGTRLYTTPQPTEQHPDDSAAVRLDKQCREAVAAALGFIRGGDYAWSYLLQQIKDITSAAEAPQPAPDASALVEALERVMYCNEVKFLPEGVQQAVSDALAAAPAVQGEPVAWSGWGCQYPGKMPRLYGERRIAELNCDWENGDQLLHFTAAPQPAKQPDVTQLVEALEQAGLALHEMDEGHAALVDIDNALAAYYRKEDEV